MLDPTLARQRQKRLLERVAAQKLDVLVITQPYHVYYLTAHRADWRHMPALVLRADGHATLISANAPARDVAADDLLAYRANPGATLRQDQAEEVAKMVIDRLGTARRIGFDTGEPASLLLHVADHEFECIDDALWQMRRVKDADELALMKKAISATRVMYERARQVIEPGISELTVYGELHTAAINTLGEPMSALLGNDFACGVGGGPPRPGRLAEAGELYILDLGPSYRGYFADNARVIAVDRAPSNIQMMAWEAIIDVFPIVERLAKPGTRCRDLYAAIDEHFHARLSQKQVHHLGHGVGLQAHEFPHLNPNWDDVLLEGEIFTCEPGIYRPELRGGLRIENQYLVTADGVENLTPFPLTMSD